jgi:hypothetical protein
MTGMVSLSKGRRGVVVVVERYRDSQGVHRQYVGCGSCGRVLHWLSADVGDVHLCDSGLSGVLSQSVIRKGAGLTK